MNLKYAIIVKKTDHSITKCPKMQEKEAEKNKKNSNFFSSNYAKNAQDRAFKNNNIFEALNISTDHINRPPTKNFEYNNTPTTKNNTLPETPISNTHDSLLKNTGIISSLC
ncbi:hypothetical protein BB558_001232, partial [Smittium angustum]